MSNNKFVYFKMEKVDDESADSAASDFSHPISVFGCIYPHALMRYIVDLGSKTGSTVPTSPVAASRSSSSRRHPACTCHLASAIVKMLYVHPLSKHQAPWDRRVASIPHVVASWFQLAGWLHVYSPILYSDINKVRACTHRWMHKYSMLV